MLKIILLQEYTKCDFSTEMHGKYLSLEKYVVMI